MAKEQTAPVPVDPNHPEAPEELIVQAARYLVDEVARCQALAADAAEARSAFSAGVLIDALRARLETYQKRGLQALVAIVNDIADKHRGSAANGGSDGSSPSA